MKEKLVTFFLITALFSSLLACELLAYDLEEELRSENDPTLILLARFAESQKKSGKDREKYELCRNAIKRSREFGLTLCEYLRGQSDLGALLSPENEPSRESLIAAKLALQEECPKR